MHACISSKKTRTRALALHPMITSTEVCVMNTDDRDNPSNADVSPTDASGKPVKVVVRDLQDPEGEEQDAGALKRKIDEIERKVADGN
jgi:hypothetical protein